MAIDVHVLDKALLYGWTHVGPLNVPRREGSTFHVFEHCDDRDVRVALEDHTIDSYIQDATALRKKWSTSFDMSSVIESLMHRIADLGPLLQIVQLAVNRKRDLAPYVSIKLTAVEPWPYDGPSDVYATISYEADTRADDLERRIRDTLAKAHRDNAGKLAQIAARPKLVERIGAVIVARTLAGAAADGRPPTLEELRGALELALPKASIASISIGRTGTDERTLDMRSARHEVAKGVTVIRRGGLVVNAGLPGITITDRIVKIRKMSLPESACASVTMAPLEEVMDLPILVGAGLKVERLWNVEGGKRLGSSKHPRITAKIASDPIDIDDDTVLREVISRSS